MHTSLMRAYPEFGGGGTYGDGAVARISRPAPPVQGATVGPAVSHQI